MPEGIPSDPESTFPQVPDAGEQQFTTPSSLNSAPPEQESQPSKTDNLAKDIIENRNRQEEDQNWREKNNHLNVLQRFFGCRLTDNQDFMPKRPFYRETESTANVGTKLYHFLRDWAGTGTGLLGFRGPGNEVILPHEKNIEAMSKRLPTFVMNLFKLGHLYVEKNGIEIKESTWEIETSLMEPTGASYPTSLESPEYLLTQEDLFDDPDGKLSYRGISANPITIRVLEKDGQTRAHLGLDHQINGDDPAGGLVEALNNEVEDRSQFSAAQTAAAYARSTSKIFTEGREEGDVRRTFKITALDSGFDERLPGKQRILKGVDYFDTLHYGGFECRILGKPIEHNETIVEAGGFESFVQLRNPDGNLRSQDDIAQDIGRVQELGRSVQLLKDAVETRPELYNQIVRERPDLLYLFVDFRGATCTKGTMMATTPFVDALKNTQDHGKMRTRFERYTQASSRISLQTERDQTDPQDVELSELVTRITDGLTINKQEGIQHIYDEVEFEDRTSIAMHRVHLQEYKEELSEFKGETIISSKCPEFEDAREAVRNFVRKEIKDAIQAGDLSVSDLKLKLRKKAGGTEYTDEEKIEIFVKRITGTAKVFEAIINSVQIEENKPHNPLEQKIHWLHAVNVVLSRADNDLGITNTLPEGDRRLINYRQAMGTLEYVHAQKTIKEQESKLRELQLEQRERKLTEQLEEPPYADELSEYRAEERQIIEEPKTTELEERVLARAKRQFVNMLLLIDADMETASSYRPTNSDLLQATAETAEMLADAPPIIAGAGNKAFILIGNTLRHLREGGKPFLDNLAMVDWKAISQIKDPERRRAITRAIYRQIFANTAKCVFKAESDISGDDYGVVVSVPKRRGQRERNVAVGNAGTSSMHRRSGKVMYNTNGVIVYGGNKAAQIQAGFTRMSQIIRNVFK